MQKKERDKYKNKPRIKKKRKISNNIRKLKHTSNNIVLYNYIYKEKKRQKIKSRYIYMFNYLSIYIRQNIFIYL